MGNVCIVAIPAQDDYVWKISSEKIPHMTLLYLGDSLPEDEVGRVANYLDFCAKTSMHQFMLDVDRRGVLGDDEADVLFFRKSRWNISEVNQFRAYLLANREINLAQASSDQFENWIPHLTLGYPTSPAKPDNRDYPGISWVSFDRVALWTGDYEGPTFELSGNSYEDDIAMMDSLRSSRTNAAVETFLAHHGIRGMKWGVRKAGSTETSSTGARKVKAIVGVTKSGRAAVITSGGSHHQPHPDAVAALKINQKLASSGSHSLSNAEIKRLLERHNLEKQLTPPKPDHLAKLKAGNQAANEILRAVGTVKNVHGLAKAAKAAAR